MGKLDLDYHGNGSRTVFKSPKGSFINYVTPLGGEGVLICVTLGRKVLVNGSNKRDGGGEGVKNLPKMCYVIYEQPPSLSFLAITSLL